MGYRSSVVTSFKGIVHFLIILSLSFSSLSVNNFSPIQHLSAAAGDGSNNNDGKELPPDVRVLLARLYNSSVVLTMRDVNAIARLESYKFYDVGEIVWDRFEAELRNLNREERTGNQADISDIFEAIFQVAPKVTTQQHREQIERSLNVLSNQMGYLAAVASKGESDEMKKFIALKEYMDTVKENLETLFNQSPKKELPKLKEPIEISGKSKPSVAADGKPSMGVTQDITFKTISREEVVEIEREISERVIGQPKAIKAVVNWIYETYAYGYGRQKPKKIWVSGLPGTGKDTLFRETINAIHKNPQAYLDHMFEMPIPKSASDLWGILGSTTGHEGSQNLSPFIRWVVKHSGGRYKIIEPGPRDKFFPFVVENKDWTPGMVLRGYTAPEESILYVNEVDKWSKANINQVLLRLAENGFIPINNPGPGIERLTYTGNIGFSSNDLIPDIASRDATGKRYGPPASIEILNERVVRIEQDPSIFRNRLLSKSGESGNNIEATGYSEEFVNRFQDQELIPLRALSEENLKSILNLNMEPVRERFKNSLGSYAGLEIEWTESLINFLYEHQKNPEEGARLMQARVSQMVSDTITQMIKDEKIKPRDLPLKATVDVEKNADGTSNLILRRTDGSNQVYAQALIAATESEKNRVSLTDAEFSELATLPQRLGKHVYGIDHLLENIGRALALSKDAERRRRDGVQQHKKAEVFFLLGFSSTGKTETGKAIAREFYKDGEASRVSIDFNNVKSPHDLREALLKFAQEYDRTNGRLVVMFEEIANAPLEVLKALYEIFDEPVVTFADKKQRPMSQVVILATGNATEEWYKDVPRDLPLDMQMATMRAIYEQMMGHQDLIRLSLEKHFSEATINRVGISRILIYPPVTHENLRKLSIARINNSIEKLKPSDGERGWRIGFRNQADYVSLVEAVENEGFVLREQARSIVNFVDTEITGKLKWELRKNAVPENARVLIVPAGSTDTEVLFDLVVEGRAEKLALKLTKRPKIEMPKETAIDAAITSFHEAGHNFIRKVLLADKYKAHRVTRIPGVSMTSSGPLVYLGMAESKVIEQLHYNKEAIIEEIAVLLGGEVAESLVTKDGRRHAGISNDIERATDLAKKAVGELGLSDAWGNRVVKPNQMSELTEAERELFNKEVKMILDQARALGEALISEPGNFEVFKEMGFEIFVKGDLNAEQIEEFYKARESRINYAGDISKLIQFQIEKNKAAMSNPQTNGLFVKRNHKVELIEAITLPSDYAEIKTILADQKNAEVSRVELPKDIPIFTDIRVSLPPAVKASERAEAPKQDVRVGFCQKLFM